jgi:ABC-type spermidine/putrescine transport system permease subunit I
MSTQQNTVKTANPLRISARWQATPYSLVFLLFFLVPLGLIFMVSFWEFNEYEMIPTFTLHSYFSIFEGCSRLNDYGDVCVTLKTYWSTISISLMVWAITLILGFAIAYFLAFCVQSSSTQTLLFVLCTVPFWTSNVIRMISWIPLLGRNGLVNQTLQNIGLVNEPVEWLLFSQFSVVLAFVHLYTMFMIVPIFNSMMRSLRFESIGPKNFNPANAHKLDAHNIRVWPGFDARMIMKEKGALLNVDVAFRVVRSDSLLDYMNQLREKAEEKQKDW